MTFEGYGPSGVAVFIEVLSDNKNRTVAELRHIFSKRNGNLGENGCVAWMFSKQGILTFEKSIGEEKLMNVVLEAGADDIRDDDTIFSVITPPSAFAKVKEACDKAEIKYIEAEVSYVPQNTVELSGSDAEKMLKLMDDLEDHDDVQNVAANFDIDSETMEKFA